MIENVVTIVDDVNREDDFLVDVKIILGSIYSLVDFLVIVKHINLDLKVPDVYVHGGEDIYEKVIEEISILLMKVLLEVDKVRVTIRL